MDSCTTQKFYATSIILERENVTFMGSLCFCNLYCFLNTHANTFLHPKELALLANFEHEKRQQSFLLGRYTAKQAIAALKGILSLDTIIIENGVFQHPIVKHPFCNNIQVSISHTSSLGASIAFEEAHPMAIDIEMLSDDCYEVIRSRLTSNEQGLFFSNTVIDVVSLWTAKEALSKVLRCGFMVSFEMLEIESFGQEHNFTIYYFKNFPQYKALTFQPESRSVCSIVCPRKTRLSIDVTAIQKALGSYSEH